MPFLIATDSNGLILPINYLYYYMLAKSLDEIKLILLKLYKHCIKYHDSEKKAYVLNVFQFMISLNCFQLCFVTKVC